MIRRMLAAAAALLMVSWCAPAFAWGAYGHATVASIAMRNVTPATRARIGALLKADGELGTPRCRARTLEEASVWADCIKGEKWRWDYMSTWHYHDQPVCGTFDIKTECANGNCATVQLDRNARILADRSLPIGQRVMALALVVHLVGDIHQPLHASDNHDQGGNAVKSSYGIVPKRNLHSIWDSALAERAISSAQPPLVHRYDEDERARLATGTTDDWLRESWEIGRDFLYPTAFGGKIPCEGKAPREASWPEPAIEASMPIVQERIQRAGLRLARMLDEALG